MVSRGHRATEEEWDKILSRKRDQLTLRKSVTFRRRVQVRGVHVDRVAPQTSFSATPCTHLVPGLPYYTSSTRCRIRVSRPSATPSLCIKSTML